MPHDKHHTLWPDGEHPSLELLRQYQQGDLPAALHHQLERHLLGCELCADVLEGMEISNLAKTKAALADINQRIQAQTQQGKKKSVPILWQSAAAILLLVASAILVLYYNYQKQQPLPVMAKTESLQKAEAPKVAASAPLGPTAPDSLNSNISNKSIAAVTPAPKYASPIVKQDAEEIFDQEVLEEVYYDDAALEGIPSRHETSAAESQTLAGVDNVLESQSMNFDSVNVSLLKEQAATMALAPESTNVSRALAGKTAGVTIRGRSTIKPTNSANQKQVSGQVLSSEGEPLLGVAVMLKGKAVGTVTDAEGKYNLAAPEGEQTLRFSYIGYETAEKTLAKNDKSADVILSPDQRALSEVVVTGYGVQRKVPEKVAKVAPLPVSGKRKYKAYLQENSRPVPVTGKVKMAFTVATNGKPQHIRVVKSLCPACDAEAIRLVQEGPRWKPAMENGQPVPQEVKITVKFKN